MIEENKIYNENCLVTMRAMNDSCIDFVLTSPPYDDLREYKGYSFDFENVSKELYRVLKGGGVIVWVVGDSTINGSETGTSFKQALFFKEIGFNLHDTMIYYKINPIPRTHNRYEQYFEYMFVLSKGKPKTFNPIMIDKNYKSDREKQGMGRNPNGTIKYVNNVNDITTKIKGNVWEYYTGGFHTTSDKVAYSHPATFPEKLAQDHIMSWSNENDLVYDPFMGSGTTAKMCLLNKRRYIGSEISEEYYKISLERMKSVNYEYLF
jgi:site-specific DNA-methyltransferase (adenine-specific)